MSHLTDEQFEQIIHSDDTQDEHLDNCPLCRSRLAEKRAIARRLRSAFANVGAPAELADRIRDRMPWDTSPARASLLGNTFNFRAYPRRWAIAAAALAAGADALFVETHPDPDHAVSDAACQIPLSEMPDLLKRALAIFRAARADT